MPEEKEDRFKSTALAGVFAGIIPKFLCHPIDTVKTNLQVDRERMSTKKLSSDFSRMVHQIRAERGIRGFFPGVGIAVIGSAPAASLYFATYEVTKKYLGKNNYFGGIEYRQFLVAGMVAESVSCLLWLPIDVIKERLQVGKFGYKDTFDAFSKIMKSEGVRGIYRAYGATIMSFGPYSALYFTFYEKLKGRIVENPMNISFLESLTLSALAGSTAAYITTPMDLAKLRMQVQRGQLAIGVEGFGYSNMFHGLYKIVKDEGVLSLYKGAASRVYYYAPITALAMSIMETFRIYFEGGRQH